MGKFKTGDRVIYKATQVTRTARYGGKRGTVISGAECNVRWDDGEEAEYLIEENLQLLPPSPIRTETVTVRRLEPGVYGRLWVGEDTTGYASVAFKPMSSHDDWSPEEGQARSLSAPELRELARVALEIAEYLDNA